MRQSLFTIVVVISISLSFYLAISCAPSECVRNSDCGVEEVCRENRCYTDCSLNNWCPDNLFCVDGACMSTECYKGHCIDDDSDSTDSDVTDSDLINDNDTDIYQENDNLPDSENIDSDNSSDRDYIIIRNDFNIVWHDINIIVPDIEFDNDSISDDGDSDLTDSEVLGDDINDDDSDSNDSDGGIFDDTDPGFNFSGMYDYSGGVTFISPELSSMFSLGDTISYTAEINRGADSFYDYSADLSDGTPYYIASDIDLESQFSDDNIYSIYYSISYVENQNCNVLVGVKQDGTGSDVTENGKTFTTFQGVESYCYVFSGTGCPVSNCGLGDCSTDNCKIEIEFFMEEKH